MRGGGDGERGGGGGVRGGGDGERDGIWRERKGSSSVTCCPIESTLARTLLYRVLKTSIVTLHNQSTHRHAHHLFPWKPEFL